MAPGAPRDNGPSSNRTLLLFYHTTAAQSFLPVFPCRIRPAHPSSLWKAAPAGRPSGREKMKNRIAKSRALARRELLASAALATLAMSLASMASAQTVEPAPGAVPLPEVDVIGVRQAPQQPGGVSETVDDLATEQATTSDTASLLRDVPGAFVYSAGGLSGLPVLDGLADDRLHIDVDGLPLLSACGNHMNSPLSYIDPSRVGDIRVYPGIVPVSVGGDSVGGAILVNPVAPKFALPGQVVFTSGKIGSYYRSNGNAFGANLAATAATENVNITYNGSFAKSENYTAGGNFKPSGPAFLTPPSPLPFTRLGTPTPWLNGNEVGSTAYQAQNHNLAIALRQENHLLKFDLGIQNIPYQWYPNQRMDMTQNDSILGNLRYTGQYEFGVLDAQLYHQKIRHMMDFGDDKQFYYGSLTGVLAPGMPMNTNASNSGAKIKASMNLLDRHVLRIGGEYQRYRYNDWWPPSPGVLPPGVAMGGMAPNAFLSINNGQRDRLDGFVELESHWTPQWMTQFGARSDTVFMNTGPVQGYNAMMYNQAPLFPATTFNNADRRRVDQNWDLTAQTTYTPSIVETYSFGYSQKSRSPNLYERYAWSPAAMAMEMIGWFGDGNSYIGNLNLQPEVAHTVSATADWHDASGTMSLQATPYFTYISNYIDVQRCPLFVCDFSAATVSNLTATQGFVRLQFINQSARLFGADISGRALLAQDTPVGAFAAKGILSYVNGQNTTTGGNLYNIMPINAKLSLEQKIDGWTNAIEAQFVGAKNNVEQVRNEVTTFAYTLFNLRSSYEWQNIRVDFGVENVFDTFYYLPLGGAYIGQGSTMSTTPPLAPPWGVSVPGMGRSFYVATNVKF